MAAFFIIEIHVDFQALIEGCLTAKGAQQAWPWTRDGCSSRGSRAWAGHFRTVMPEPELPLVRKRNIRKVQDCQLEAVKVVFSREAIPGSLSYKSAHTSIHWDKKTGDLKLPACKIGKWCHNLYLAVICHRVLMHDKNTGVFFNGNNSPVPHPPVTFVSGKKSLTLCQLIKSRK